MRIPLAIHLLPIKALVSTILACDITEIAADAIFNVDMGLDVIIKVQISPVGDALDGPANYLVDARKALLVKIVVEAVDHIFDDAIAIMHNGGVDLNRAGSEQHKLDR